MSFIRTVTGDLSVEQMGICYSHEHVVLRGPFIERSFPELRLDDLEKICCEIAGLRELGVQTMIDAMPTDAGRSALDLAEVSRRTGMHIVASTGLHLRTYYPQDHWYDLIDEDALTELFVKEIESGVTDAGVEIGVRAGVIKIAGSKDRLSKAERRNFRAAGRAQNLTGCPILTHTEQGTAAPEQIEILRDAGADLSHVVLSHLDRIPDAGYHREVLTTGVRLEYDSAFRWKGEPNVTRDLVLALAHEFPNSLVLGMDAAKFSYWSSFGGSPGLGFLLRTFGAELLNRGLAPELLHKIFCENPASCYAFGAATGGNRTSGFGVSL